MHLGLKLRSVPRRLRVIPCVIGARSTPSGHEPPGTETGTIVVAPLRAGDIAAVATRETAATENAAPAEATPAAAASAAAAVAATELIDGFATVTTFAAKSAARQIACTPALTDTQSTCVTRTRTSKKSIVFSSRFWW